MTVEAQRRIKDKMRLAPDAGSFPGFPQSWYFFCASRDLKKGPVEREIAGHRFVGFRTDKGSIGILDAACCHLGASLGKGRVVGERIQCPYHQWEYAANGRCERIPSQEEIPAFARQESYPVSERHGYIFFFNAQKPLFPLPFFEQESPEDYLAGSPLSFIGDCSWHMFAANTFDVQHWKGVHARQLIGEQRIDAPKPYARRARFQAAVIGSSIYDRILKWLGGKTVEISITNWGGTFMVVRGTFRRTTSQMIVCTQPLSQPHQLLVTVLVMIKRPKVALLRPLTSSLSLWLRRRFTWAFLHNEFEELAGIRYSPQSLIQSDEGLIEYFHWAAGLPGSPIP